MNYIDELALAICTESGMPFEDASYRRLGRIYALLLLIKGKYVTREDVHDAWSVWQLDIDPQHRSLIPFDELTKKVQDLDQPYVDAIRAIAKHSDV